VLFHQALMSLKRIAEELGLSLTTVSRALNGYPEVSQATRTAVLAAAKKHHYQPNTRARSLALGRADSIGVVFPITPTDLGDVKFLEVSSSLSEHLGQAGLDLLIISATARDELEAYRRAMAGRRVDAFVVPRTRVHDERLELLQSANKPFVAYGRSADFKQPYAWVDFDNVAGSRMAAERLIAFGHRHIGYIGAAASYNFSAQRYLGFATALKAEGLALNGQAVQRGALDRRSGYAAMQYLLAMPEPPTAILVDNHLAGVGAVHAALHAGRQLGKDLSVIVYDGLGADSVIHSAITSVDQPTASRIGVVLAEVMLARLRGDAPETLQREYMPVLLPGESDGPPHLT
jgi:LacI family transcriptional regulator